ncbi:MAG TPA: SIS domain-containing protein [Methylomirabilota bacterium]|nr:SIS domain-containing protein [Methylomirabilota bacterium]
MINEVREQSDVFARIVQNRKSISEIARKTPISSAHSLFVVGCGSSYYASVLSGFYHEHLLGLDSRAAPSSEFIWYPPQSKSLALMALSRSGKTTETLEAIRRAKKLEVPTIAVTADPSSPMGKESNYCLDIEVGQERSVVMTKSFTASTLVSILLGFELSKVPPAKRNEIDRDLLQLSGDAGRLIHTVEAQAKKTAESMRQLKRFIYLGSGATYGACLEGALKLRETSYTMCEVYHIPEFRHGPFALVQKDVGVVAIVPEDKTLKQSEMLLREIASQGGTVIPISNVSKITDAYKDSIRLPEDISYNFMPLLSVIPMQMLAFHYAVSCGLDPDSPRNLTKFVATDFGD